MDINQIVIDIDAEIARLAEAQSILSNGILTTRRKQAKSVVVKRIISPEARERIAAAQRRRWAARRNAK